jgi:hypothetical protein
MGFRRRVLWGGLALAPTALRSVTANPCCSKLEDIGFSSNLPVVIIESVSGTEIKYDEYQEVNLCTCTPAALAAEKNIEDYNGKAEAAGRGNSSADFEKTQFKIKLQDESGEKLSHPFLGFDSERRFILNGPGETDRSMMFNYMAYTLGRASGEYAPNNQFVEVFSSEDGQPLSLDDYRGVYLAVEKLDADRVGLEEDITDENPTGGYLLKYDNDNYAWDETTVGPFTYWGMDQPFVITEPDELSEVQKTYITDYLNQFMQALMNDDWLNPSIPDDRKYTSYIDVDSFIKYMLAVELTKNPDGYRGSTYLHKDRDSPLQAGPMWDYNEAFGMCCGYPIEGYWDEGRSDPGIAGGTAISPEGFRFLICEDPERCLADPTDGISFWYRRMWNDPAYRNATSAAWSGLRDGPWSDDEIHKIFDTGFQQLSDGPARRNYEAYSEILGDSTTETWLNATTRLENWLFDRVSWMDRALESPKADYSQR